MERLRAPRLTSHTSPPPKCVSVTGPVQTVAGTAGMPAAAWGSMGLSWVSHGCLRCPSGPCSHTWGGLLTQAAAEAAPDGRRRSIGTLGGPPPAGPPCPLQAGGQAAGCRTRPRGFGAPRFPGRLRAGGGLASPQPRVPWTVRLPGTQHRGPHTQEAVWGPSFLGTSFSRVLATGPTWEPAPETQFLRSSTQPQAAQRRELLLFTARLSRAGRHPLPDWARVGVLATDWVLPTG